MTWGSYKASEQGPFIRVETPFTESTWLLPHDCHAEKLWVVQLLLNQIAEKEVILTGTEYEVWSPYDTPGAAAILTEMFEKDRQQNE